MTSAGGDSAEDRALADRLLGPGCMPAPIEGTSHAISAWRAVDGRRMVIKRSPRATREAEVYRCLAGAGLAPALIDAGPGHVAIAWQEGMSLIDAIDPAGAGGSLPIFAGIVEAMARFHDLTAGLSGERGRGPVPGRHGFGHGDALPHNLLIAPDGRIALIDFEKASHLPQLLDLVPALCVLPTSDALAMVDLYLDRRGIPNDGQDRADALTLLRQYPALRLERLRGQQAAFRDATERFRRMCAWMEHAARLGR